jgi:hypothetical protein
MARGMKTRVVIVHGRIVAPAGWEFNSRVEKMKIH